PFSAGAGALGILSPYGPGYNGFNNSSNLGKFASKNKKASMWSEMEDGVNGLNVQLGVLKKFEELNRNKNSDTKAASLAGTLIKAAVSMLNIMFDNDALDVTSDAVGFSADTVTNSYSWVQKFKETHSFKNGAGMFSKMGTMGKEGFKHLGSMGKGFGQKIGDSWKNFNSAKGFLGKTKNVASGAGDLFGKVKDFGGTQWNNKMGLFGKVASSVAAVGSVFDGVNAYKDFKSGDYKGVAE